MSIILFHLPDILVHDKSERAKSRPEIHPKAEYAVSSAQCLGVSEVRVDQTDTRWDAGRLKSCKENTREQDLEEGMAEIGGGCR
jgi:hypothetical protein